MKKIRLLLADDHAILRAGLRVLLDAQPDMTVVAEAADGHEALDRARVNRPDVAVVDLTMPGHERGPDPGALRREVPATRLLVLTMHDDPAYAGLTLAAGATGHVVKDAESAELLAAIRAVHRGRTFVRTGDGVEAGMPSESDHGRGAAAQPARAPGPRAARSRPHQPRGRAATHAEREDDRDLPLPPQRQARPAQSRGPRPPGDGPGPAHGANRRAAAAADASEPRLASTTRAPSACQAFPARRARVLGPQSGRRLVVITQRGGPCDRGRFSSGRTRRPRSIASGARPSLRDQPTRPGHRTDPDRRRRPRGAQSAGRGLAPARLRGARGRERSGSLALRQAHASRRRSSSRSTSHASAAWKSSAASDCSTPASEW